MSPAPATASSGGNRTNAGYSTAAGNRVVTDGLWTYTYDAEGNLIKKSQGTGVTWTYIYDERNQLQWVRRQTIATGHPLARPHGPLQQRFDSHL